MSLQSCSRAINEESTLYIPVVNQDPQLGQRSSPMCVSGVGPQHASMSKAVRVGHAGERRRTPLQAPCRR